MKAIAVGFLIGHIATSHAETFELKNFVTEALKYDPQVLEQVHIHHQAVEDEKLATAGWHPSLDYSLVAERFHDKNLPQDVDSYAENSLTLTQNLFDGFDTVNAIEQTRARISSAVYRVMETADNSALEAIKAYLNVLSEYRQVQLAKQNVKAHERISAQLREQSDAGIAVKISDVEQTEGRLASAKASLISQQNNLEDALTQANKLLGRNIDPATLVTPEAPPLPEGTIEELIEKALMVHPALKSAQENIEAVKYDYERSKKAWWPTVDLQLQRTVGHNIGGDEFGDDTETSVLVSVQYNFYNGGADIAEQRKRVSAIQEQEAFRSRVQRQAIDALRLSWAADLALHEQLPFLRRHVDKSEKALGFFYEEFLDNQRDLLDVLDAESEYNTAQKKEVENAYLALAARYRVYEAMGNLFDVLKLDVDVSDRDLIVADISTISTNAVYTQETKDTGKPGIYTPVIVEDVDKDTILRLEDQCDNTILPSEVNKYGCVSRFEPSFGYVSINNPPKATDDFLTTGINQALDIAPEDILGNDVDPDQDRLRIEEFSKPTYGSVIEDAEGYLIYSPREGFTGTDSFTYTISDGYDSTSTGTVTINIGPSEGGN
jgi:adhesin transport system outer membrane protein